MTFWHSCAALERAQRVASVISASATKAADIDEAVEAATRAGARILRRGEFSPGFPFLYILDPDGYEIEIWYE